MPAGDKTGPTGKGPGTGRRQGGCLPVSRSGFIGGKKGTGKGKGMGRKRRFGPPQIGFGKGFLRGN